MRTNTKRDIVKGIFLLGPLTFLVLFLALFGAGIERFFAELFSGYQSHEYGAYTIFTPKDSSEHEAAGKVVQEFTDNIVKQFGTEFKIKAPDPKTQRIKIYLLPSAEELEEYGLQRLSKNLENNGGYYLPSKREIALVTHKNKEGTARGLRHEVMHALMDLSNPDGTWSPWLSEGMASYFEHSRKIGSRWTPGGRPEDRPAGDALLSLRGILSSESKNFTGKDNTRFYRSSQLLVAYLFEQRRAEFFAYYRKEMEGSKESNFVESFGPLAEVQQGWDTYLRSRK